MVRTIPLRTFAGKVEPIVRLCQTILAKHGEPCPKGHSPEPGSSYRGGYRFPAPVEAGSEPDYALKILWTLNIARRATDLDEAMKHAWDAGQLVFDAHVVFKGKRTALHLAFKAGQVHTTRALRRRTGANRWQKEIDGRRPGRSKHAVMEKIAARDGVTVDTVKKGLQRRRARLKKLSASPKK